MGWGVRPNRNAERNKAMRSRAPIHYFSHLTAHNDANIVLTCLRGAERISEEGQTIRTKETDGFHS